jgi:hypothetical protein
VQFEGLQGRIKNENIQLNRMYGERKEKSHCNLVLSVQKQKDPWYIDSGCSKHMSGDKEKFITLSERKAGKVTFGKNAPGKVRGT